MPINIKKKHLKPDDPRIVAAVLQRIREMPFEELEARLAYRTPGVIERRFPNPEPVTAEERSFTEGNK